jgi:hypothetical protein
MTRRLLADVLDDKDVLEEKPVGYLVAIDPLFGPIRAREKGRVRR